jgi:signal transduction histidine kinase
MKGMFVSRRLDRLMAAAHRRLVPSPIRCDPQADRVARLVVSSSFAVAFTTTGLAAARFVLDGPDSAVGFVLAAAVVACLAIPLVLRVTGSLRYTRPLLPLFGMLGTSSMALIEGGLASEALHWFIFIPLVAVLFVGARGAAVFGALGAAILTALLVEDPITQASFLRYAGALGALGFGALLGGLYENARRRAERHKGEFVSVVSHELRTPLTSLQGSLALLEAGAAGQLPEEAEEMLLVARRNSTRLGALIDDLLSIQTLDSDRIEPQLDSVALQVLLANAADRSAAMARSLGVEIELSAAVPEAIVTTDRSRLQLVLEKLVSNALKFSPTTQPVTLGASIEADGTRIWVSDRGPGIPRDFRPHMFEPFSQADGSATRAVGGAGLGLAVARKLAEGIGGTLELETKTGHGTTVSVCLPG